jgi:hypothetical protein
MSAQTLDARRDEVNGQRRRRGAQLVYQYGVGVHWSKALPQK